MRDTAARLALYLDALGERALPGGGLAPDAVRRRDPRPDATAWGILALRAAGRSDEILATSRTWLASRQQPDGRVCLTPNHLAAAWPTPLAILAWHGSPAHVEAQERAVAFLLTYRGLAFPRTPLLGHDTTLVGWPWIESTHSWVEPTAFGLMALIVTGNASHARAIQASELLVDRRLALGGWNYGNTAAFGRAQRPAPDSTGVALSALIEVAEHSLVELSLDYLDREVSRVRTPLSLAWTLLGLSAWNRRPEAAVAWCLECLERQTRLGSYDTALLALVLLAAHVSSGLVGSLAGDDRTFE
ncbi:MAG: terpene cyclase/mutase family protein [bacterium]|nr:terpene cyclase/mutase family protein [bacterium]